MTQDNTTGALGGARALPGVASEMTQAARDVLAERKRQIAKEGWSAEHDDDHEDESLGAAAACYASPVRAFKEHKIVGRGYEVATVYRDLWPWSDEWWKPKDRRTDLVRAGALILAEIERLDRAAEKSADNDGAVQATSVQKPNEKETVGGAS